MKDSLAQKDSSSSNSSIQVSKPPPLPTRNTNISPTAKSTTPVDLASFTYLLPADISSNSTSQSTKEIESEPSSSSVRAQETTAAANSETVSKNSELNVSEF